MTLPSPSGADLEAALELGLDVLMVLEATLAQDQRPGGSVSGAPATAGDERRVREVASSLRRALTVLRTMTVSARSDLGPDLGFGFVLRRAAGSPACLSQVRAAPRRPPLEFGWSRRASRGC